MLPDPSVLDQQVNQGLLFNNQLVFNGNCNMEEYPQMFQITDMYTNTNIAQVGIFVQIIRWW